MLFFRSDRVKPGGLSLTIINPKRDESFPADNLSKKLKYVTLLDFIMKKITVILGYDISIR